jgi:hypothetical protein
MKIRFLTFLIILLVSYKASSQNAIKTNKDSVVILSKGVAIKVLQDLTRYDYLKIDSLNRERQIEILNLRLQNKDSIINEYDKLYHSYYNLSKNLSEQKDILIQQRDSWQSKFKFQRRMKTLTQIYATGAVILLLILKR